MKKGTPWALWEIQGFPKAPIPILESANRRENPTEPGGVFEDRQRLFGICRDGYAVYLEIKDGIGALKINGERN